jgi:hypothetical protein
MLRDPLDSSACHKLFLLLHHGRLPEISKLLLRFFWLRVYIRLTTVADGSTLHSGDIDGHIRLEGRRPGLSNTSRVEWSEGRQTGRSVSQLARTGRRIRAAPAAQLAHLLLLQPPTPPSLVPLLSPRLGCPPGSTFRKGSSVRGCSQRATCGRSCGPRPCRCQLSGKHRSLTRSSQGAAGICTFSAIWLSRLLFSCSFESCVLFSSFAHSNQHKQFGLCCVCFTCVS